MVRQGLRSVLETYPDIEVVGEASDGKQAVISVTSPQLLGHCSSSFTPT
jgi:DNA-binding NarL/FixJ family response regulator